MLDPFEHLDNLTIHQKKNLDSLTRALVHATLCKQCNEDIIVVVVHSHTHRYTQNSYCVLYFHYEFKFSLDCIINSLVQNHL